MNEDLVRHVEDHRAIVVDDCRWCPDRATESTSALLRRVEGELGSALSRLRVLEKRCAELEAAELRRDNFTVQAAPAGLDEGKLELSCRHCDWWPLLGGEMPLVELVRRALEHGDAHLEDIADG